MKNEAVFSFYIEKKSRLNNLHIIHTKNCDLLPDKQGRIKLGSFDNFEEVIENGKVEFNEVKLCKYCCDF